MSIDWNVDLSSPECLLPILKLRYDAQIARLPMDSLQVRLTPAMAEDLRDFAERITRFGGGDFSLGLGDRIFGMLIVSTDAEKLEMLHA